MKSRANLNGAQTAGRAEMDYATACGKLNSDISPSAGRDARSQNVAPEDEVFCAACGGETDQLIDQPLPCIFRRTTA